MTHFYHGFYWCTHMPAIGLSHFLQWVRLFYTHYSDWIIALFARNSNTLHILQWLDSRLFLPWILAVYTHYSDWVIAFLQWVLFTAFSCMMCGQCRFYRGVMAEVDGLWLARLFVLACVTNEFSRLVCGQSQTIWWVYGWSWRFIADLDMKKQWELNIVGGLEAPRAADNSIVNSLFWTPCCCQSGSGKGR